MPIDDRARERRPSVAVGALLRTRRAGCGGPDDGKSTATQSINAPIIQLFEMRLCTRKRLGLLGVDVIGAPDGPLS